MRIDLHTHSSVSDGTDAPADLVRAAAAAGLDVVALTDHDTVDGWAEVLGAAEAVGVRVVPGVEISTRWRGESVHLLGYLVDPAEPALAAELRRVRAGRVSRTATIVERLRAAGLDLTVEDVLRAAGPAVSPGRPHVADALVARGVVADRSEAFARWLGRGRPGAVPKPEPATLDALRLVRGAGGVAVVAHPWGRTTRRVLDAEALGELASAGLTGVEVDHHDHDAEARSALRGIASDLGLVVTGSSDHHGSGKRDHALGSETTDPAQLEALLAAAAAR